MKKIFIILTLVPFFYSCSIKHTANNSTKLASINIVDRNGFTETINSKQRLSNYQKADFLQHQPYKKVMRVYRPNKNGSSKAVITSYYSNGQVKQYLEVLDNRAYGKYKEWFSNGNKKLEANTIGGIADLTPSAESSWIFDGYNYAWNEEGCLSAQIPYVKGKLNGVAKTFYHNGKIQRQTPYKNDKVEGLLKTFRENGELWSQTTYVENLRNGTSTVLWPNGSTAAQEDFLNDSLVSGSYYNFNNEIISKIINGTGFRSLFSEKGLSEQQEYKNGKQDGIIKILDENQNVSHSFVLHNGIKDGLEIIYFPHSTTPHISIYWSQGAIQGQIKTWYKDGKKESCREMSENQKNGITTVWYPNGSIMLIEDYINGILTKGEYHRLGERNPISKVIDGNGHATIFDSKGNIIRKISYTNGTPSAP